MAPWTVAHHGILCPWDYSTVHGKNTGVGCCFPLQGIFLTQGSNPCLLHLLRCQVYSLPLSHLGSPEGLKTSPEVLSMLQGPSDAVHFSPSPPNHGSLCVHSDLASLKNCVMLKKLHDPRLIMLPSFLPLEHSSSAVPLQTSYSPSVTCRCI